MLEKRIRKKISWERRARCAGELTLGQGGQRGSQKAILSKEFEGREVRVTSALWEERPRQGERNRKIRRHEAHASRCWKEGPCGWRERGDRGVGRSGVLGAVGRAGEPRVLSRGPHATAGVQSRPSCSPANRIL